MSVTLAGALLAPTSPGAVQVFGVTLVGVSTTTGVKLLFNLGLVLAVLAVRGLALAVTRRLLGGQVGDPRRSWARQGIQVVTAVVLLLGTVSIWVTPQTNLTTGLGLVRPGLAFALQQVILSLAAYFVILRGDIFGVGDRITLGGVRGDVVRHDAVPAGEDRRGPRGLRCRRAERGGAGASGPLSASGVEQAGEPDRAAGPIQQPASTAAGRRTPGRTTTTSRAAVRSVGRLPRAREGPLP